MAILDLLGTLTTIPIATYHIRRKMQRSVQGAVPASNAPREIEVIVRPARGSDFPALREFYRARVSKALPAPSVRDLGHVLENGRLILVEPSNNGHFLATSAIFDFTPDKYKHYVGEMSGTYVEKRLAGCLPVSMQRILLGFRLLSFVAYNAPSSSQSSSSLISIVKGDNSKSINNLVKSHFERLDEVPEWFDYEQIAWNGDLSDGEWLYFMATDKTVRRSIDDLCKAGLFKDKIVLERYNRENKQQERINIRYEMEDIWLAREDILAIKDNKRSAGLTAPPADLVLT